MKVGRDTPSLRPLRGRKRSSPRLEQQAQWRSEQPILPQILLQPRKGHEESKSTHDSSLVSQIGRKWTGKGQRLHFTHGQFLCLEHVLYSMHVTKVF